jgi:hypothetical protein
VRIGTQNSPKRFIPIGYVVSMWLERTHHKKSLTNFESYDNTEVVVIDEEGTPNSMMWRFTACDDDDVEMFISRDTDSRLSIREKEAVDEWIESGRNFHIMRDHPYHVTAIMGGMWGMRKDAIKGMKTKIENFIRGGYHEDKKGADQAFLWGLIWPIAMNENLTHDPFFTENAPFPTVERDPEATGLLYRRSGA